MDRAGLEELYQRYFPLLREKCRRMVRDEHDAEDLAQETFVRFWRDRARVEQAPAAVAWLYRTSTRLAIDKLRRGRLRLLVDATTLEDALLAGPAFNPEAQAAVQAVLGRLATRLSVDEIELAIFQWLDGMSQAEMAAVTGVSDRTVRRRLRSLEEKIAVLRKELAA